MRRWLGVSVVFAPYAILLAQQGAAPEKVSFGRDVAPILKMHCLSCHSGSSPGGGLDLQNTKNLMKGGDSGLAIVAGKPEASLLIQRIEGKGGLPRMPKAQSPLSEEETTVIRDWIAAGAKFDAIVPRHWAYVTPTRPPVPKLASEWVHNPIDAFVLDKMTEAGLHPAPEASRETLIRRVSLDLIGLPPTLKEIDDFVADKHPDAYERLVDGLLASPQYGVRQARGWLDLARYADTDGFEKDLNRTAWKYRDWVIDAFNKNLSYKDFAIDQIAGDMLPNATLDQKIATGFNRNTMFNREGGVDQEEAHFGVITDRVDTTATVFLGSTLQCARCHDHKYDPFTQRDYYKLAAFFSNSRIHPQGPKEIGEEKWFEPEIPAATPEQAAKITSLQQEIKSVETELAAPSAQTVSLRQADAPTVFTVILPRTAVASSGVKLQIQPDGSVLATGSTPDQDTYTLAFPASDHPIRGLKLEALTDPTLPKNGPGRADNGNFVLTGVKIDAKGLHFQIAGAAADYVQDGFDPYGAVAGDAASGWAIHTREGQNHELRLQLASAIPPGTPFTLVLEQHYATDETHLIGKFRLSTAPDAAQPTILLTDDILKVEAKTDRTAAEEAMIRSAREAANPTVASLHLRRATLRKTLRDLTDSIPTAMVMEELPGTETPFAYVRLRGEFLTKTDRVEAGTPTVLPPLPPGRPDRLALAKWLVSPYNPLTARVEVNRIWEQYFGRGLVETSEDFGTRGSRPINPQLLDWLAVELMHNGWDMKAIHRLIVTSATYRQSSAATPELVAKDPQNLLFARGPRFRMEAESIHDAALAESGLLSLKMGGPSVMPYQPDGIWDSPYSGERWMTSKGDDRYRRGVYTFAKRTAPYPSFLTLDSTSRETCTVRRIRTNTPLQALALLNDKLMIEAAKSLAKEMMDDGKTDDQHLAAGFRICTARRPLPDEQKRLDALLAKLETRYSANPKAAAELGKTSRDAAYTMVGNVLLNLDETITKG